MSEDDATAIFELAGLTPLEPYRASDRPWRAAHSCGRIVTPTLSNVRAGRGICRYCNSSFPFDSVADVYLVRNPRALKIGICAPNSVRLTTHRRHGWTHLWSIRVPTGDIAYELEQAIIAWWRLELRLTAAYATEDMPQWGATETVDASRIADAEVLRFARARLSQFGYEFTITHAPIDQVWLS